VVVNNAAGVTFTSGDMRMTGLGSLACQSGVLNTGIGKVILNSTATISETISSYVLGNVESTRTLTNVSNNFGGIGFAIAAAAAEPGVTTVLRNTGNSISVGCSNSSILRNFTVTAAVNTGLNAAISFGYNPTAELNGLNQGELDLFMGSTALNANAGVTSFSKSGVDGFSGVITAAIPQTLYYLDADADGYAATGQGSTQLSCTSPGANWVTTSLGSDCDDANVAVNPAASEVCDDFIDNDCEGGVDEYCSSLLGNDSPTYAVNLQYSVNVTYPNCFPIMGDLSGATDSPQSAAYTGVDEWYKFTAQSTAVSVTLSSSTQDDFIALYEKVGNNYVLIATENAASSAGDFERLNQGGLTPGNIYYVSVGAATGSVGGAYSLCIQHLMPSTCATVVPAGGLNLCDSYKATYRGAPSQGVTYTFNFTPTGSTGGSATSLSGTNGLITLSNPTLALRYAGTYAASVDVRYNLLNGAGTAEPVDVLGSAGGNCANVVMRAQPNTEVRGTQRCNASLLRSNWLVGNAVAGDPKACGVQNYTYEFTQVVSCADGTSVSVLPSSFNTAGSTPYMQLGVLPNLGNVGAWDVRIRPNFAYGSGTYGPVQRIQVAGTAASGELLYEVVDAEKELEVGNTLTAIYPNPSNGDFVHVKLSNLERGQLQLRVLDAAGRALTTRVYAVEGSFNTTLSFDQQLSAGVYMIEMTNAGSVQTQRLIVE
jgi:hypothetical protein